MVQLNIIQNGIESLVSYWLNEDSIQNFANVKNPKHTTLQTTSTY